MASTNKTTNYELSQFIGSDQLTRADYNADMLKIATAIKTVADAAAGGPIEMQKTSTHIQWRYVGDATWINLVALADITGPAGEAGADGTNGADGANGADGSDGRGITSIVRTSGTGAAGTTDTYTITFTDSTTATFTVYNGANGEGAGDMTEAIWATGGAINVAKGGTGSTTGDTAALKTAFTAAGTRANISTGETHATLFGKIAKWFADLGALAFKATVGTTDIDNSAITSAKLANMAAKTVKGNLGTSSTVPSDVTMLDVIEYGLDAGTTATSIADAEYLPISVSATSVKKITWAHVKTAIQTALSTVFAAVSHVHGSITSDGKVGTTADQMLVTGTGGAVATATPAQVLAAIGAAKPGLYVSGLTLPTTGYTGTGPYTIDITATGVVTTAGKCYYIDAVFSDTDATRELEQTAWNLIIDRKISAANTLRLKLSAVPATAVTFYVKEVV